MVRSRRRSVAFIAFIALVTLTALGLAGVAGCSGAARPRDVAGDRRPRRDEPDSGPGDAASTVPAPPPAATTLAVIGKKPRVFARASCRAIALDKDTVYYGDSEDDAIYSMPKAGGTPVHVSRHAPVAGAIALEGESIAWVASPGDAVLRISAAKGGQPTTLRDRGIFSDVAYAGEHLFIAEALGSGGALIRITGATATRIAAFDGAPRAVMTDATHAYVVTPTKIFRTPHLKGEVETIASGKGFFNPEIDEKFVYSFAQVGGAHVVVRLPKAGGPMTTIARDVRDGPAEIAGAEFYYLDANKPQLRVVPAGGGESRVVSEDESFATATAIEADEKTIYIAVGQRETGLILAVDR